MVTNSVELGLRGLNCYESVVGDTFRAGDETTHNEIEEVLDGCGDTLALFVYRECHEADDAEDAARMLRKAAEELMDTANELQGAADELPGPGNVEA